jgi:hypothetical protein
MFEESGAFEFGKIDNVVAERDPNPRIRIARLENTEGQILQWKVRISWNVDERS